MIQKAFKTHWSKQLRTLNQIEEIQINVRRPQDWESERFLVRNSDITPKKVTELIADEAQAGHHLGQRIFTFLDKIGDTISCYTKKKKEQAVFVKVDIVPLDWIINLDQFEGHKLLSLIPILESIDDEQLYTTHFIDAMKELAIMLNREAFNWCFLPFMLQVVTCCAYFNFIVLNENPERTIFYWLLEAIVFLTTIYFLVIEYF